MPSGSRPVWDVSAPAGGWGPPWPQAAELARTIPSEQWTLVGGLIVQLHAAYAGLPPTRPTVDVDMVLHLDTGATTFGAVRERLEELGYELRPPAGDGPAHRFVRGDDRVDVMVADHLAPSRRPRVAGRDVFAVPAEPRRCARPSSAGSSSTPTRSGSVSPTSSAPSSSKAPRTGRIRGTGGGTSMTLRCGPARWSIRWESVCGCRATTGAGSGAWPRRWRTWITRPGCRCRTSTEGGGTGLFVWWPRTRPPVHRNGAWEGALPADRRCSRRTTSREDMSRRSFLKEGDRSVGRSRGRPRQWRAPCQAHPRPDRTGATPLRRRPAHRPADRRHPRRQTRHCPRSGGPGRPGWTCGRRNGAV